MNERITDVHLVEDSVIYITLVYFNCDLLSEFCG